MGKTVLQVTVIFVVGLLLTTPAMLAPPMTHDSFGIDWVWADQFTSELAKGNLYPRWLPLSNGGLGSPAFYYYPPLAFYLTGLFGLSGLPTDASIIAAFFTGLVASGLSMYAWLKNSAKAPLFGALLFMVAPYHVLDFYSRGAIAEFLAIAFIPLVALGLRAATQGRFILCAITYAGLILTHLPLALLVSLFFVIPYGLYLSKLELRRLILIALPISLGIAIAAIYLLPAIALGSYRDSAELWHRDVLKPENWTLLHWDRAGVPLILKLLVGTMILVLLQPIVVLLFSAQRWWGVYAVICCALAAALVPALWQLPLIKAVQFPYRVLPLAEFAVATGIAHLTLPRLLTFAAPLPVFALSIFFAFGPRIAAGPDTPPELIAQHVDVPENLPPGDRSSKWSWALEIAQSHPGPVRVGDQTVEPVFFFPAWEVRCQGRRAHTTPEASTKLLTYKGTGCERRLVPTMPERIGTAISLAGLLLLLGLAPFRRRRSLRTNVNDSDFVGVDASPVG